MIEFLHVGVPTIHQQPNEMYIKDLKVYVTNPDEHELKFEYLRYKNDTPLPEIIQKNPHIAYKVENIDEMIKNMEVIAELIEEDEKTRIVFVLKDGVILELMEVKE